MKVSKEAQKIFTPHQKLGVRIKKNAVNPFGSTAFETFLKMRKRRPKYQLYIHLRNSYMTFSCPDDKFFEPVYLAIDEKLWVEILNIFELIWYTTKKSPQMESFDTIWGAFLLNLTNSPSLFPIICIKNSYIVN